MKIGDLVVATFRAVEPTSWYKQLYNTQEPAVVIEIPDFEIPDLPHGCMLWIYYRGGRRLCAKTNLKIVSKNEFSSR